MTYTRLTSWWHDPRSSVTLNRIEAFAWAGFGLAGLLIRPLRESIPVLFFVSCYANTKGAWSTAASARVEVKEDERD